MKAVETKSFSIKALLVYPEFPDTYWSLKHALAFERKQASFPPLGLLTVSALLPEAWERRLVDMNVRTLNDSDIEWADVVLVSAMIVQKDSMQQVIKRGKALGKRVMVGGPYVTTSAEEAIEADHIFLGEAETTLPEFINDFARGEAKRVYEAAERPPLSISPRPHFHLAELRRYNAMSVQFSRGCPFQCEFCDIIEIYGRVPRTKSNQQLIAELDALRQLDWHGLVFIVDDNFIGNKRNVKLLLPELAEWSERYDYPFSFLTEASVNLADDEELLESMRRAGFRRVFLGIETPVEESLKETRKNQNTRRDLLESVHKIQSHAMEVLAGFIVGFDNDPEDIFDRQINFIRESAIPMAMVGMLTALPDTQLWRRLNAEGRLLGETGGNLTHSALNYIPRMDSSQLVEGYKRILRTIYSPQEYYRRSLDCLTRVVHDRREKPPISAIEMLLCFVRVMFALGIRDTARREFWRYLWSAAANHRNKFAYAVVLAAIGYHFRRITETYCTEETPVLD
jgi:radical SAM superfamily enzyme YgiQ (UPF0313 family)